MRSAVAVVVVLILAGEQHAALQQDGLASAVVQTDMNRWKKELANWGRWGAEDERGTFHFFAHTHLDALAHHFLDGRMYNGFAREAYVTMEGGAAKGSVLAMRDGIVTRGALVDLPRSAPVARC